MTDPQLLTYLADKKSLPSPIAVHEDNHISETPFLMLSDSSTVSSPDISSPDIDDGDSANESDPDETPLEIADSIMHNLSETPLPLNDPTESNTPFANILSNISIDPLNPDLDSNQVITIENQTTNIFIPDDLSETESYDHPFSMVSENTPTPTPNVNINNIIGSFKDSTERSDDHEQIDLNIDHNDHPINDINHIDGDQDDEEDDVDDFNDDIFGENDELGINRTDNNSYRDDELWHDEDWWISEEYYMQD